MTLPDRRSFLGASLGAAATAAACYGRQPPPLPPPAHESFQPSTLFLTWRRDPTTTMTVQWVGTAGETADSRVYHRPSVYRPSGPLAAAAGATITAVPPAWAATPTAKTPYHPATDLKVFRAELSGLTPDTDYDFRLGKESPTYRFRTMPARATDPIAFVSGGDCGVNAHAVANNIQAARQDPMFAVIGGDLGYDNGTSVATSLAFLRNYSKHMVGRDGRLIPLVACIGNHEVSGGYNQPRAKAPFFYSLFDGLYPDTGYATLDFGDYLSLVLLDTGHTSAVAGDQTDWLDKTLAARRDHPHVMVVNHVPAYPSHRSMTGLGGLGLGGTGGENRRHWVPLFERHRVPVVLEHHDHTFKRTKPLVGGLGDDNGVLYLGDGSWGQLRSPQRPEKLTVMARTSQDYHLSLHRIQGNDRYHLALDEAGRVMDVARTGQRTAGLVRATE